MKRNKILKKKNRKECVWWDSPQTQTVPHTPLQSSIAKMKKKGAQRMWCPLCFHFNFEMKIKLKDKMVCVCVEKMLHHAINTLTHTPQTVF